MGQILSDFAGCKTSFSMDVFSSASEWVSPPIKKPFISSILMNMVVRRLGVYLSIKVL